MDAPKRPTYTPRVVNSAPANGDIQCDDCGAHVSATARFCGMCGAKLPQPGEIAPASLIGQTVAKGAYRIISHLGTGSMGVVYQAE
ncbi:MAG: hypothetical protein KC561_02765, partial [Myxococcales bacterium]|nr:hypothetical protein [Myxococcales bacterium]